MNDDDGDDDDDEEDDDDFGNDDDLDDVHIFAYPICVYDFGYIFIYFCSYF